MTFVPEAVLEARSAELWRKFSLEVGFDIESLLDLMGLGLLWDNVEDQEGQRVLGQLDASSIRVVLNQRHMADLEAKGGALRRFTIAHEIGHWVLHANGIRSGTLSLLKSGRTWCRDGSRDPVERQAEMFAGRLLVPRDLLQTELPGAPWSGWSPVYRLAQHFIVTPTAMIVRLQELGWAHLDERRTPISGREAIKGQTQLLLG